MGVSLGMALPMDESVLVLWLVRKCKGWTRPLQMVKRSLGRNLDVACQPLLGASRVEFVFGQSEKGAKGADYV